MEIAQINEVFLMTGCQKTVIQMLNAPPPEKPKRVCTTKELRVQKFAEETNRLTKDVESASARLERAILKGWKRSRVTPFRTELSKAKGMLKTHLRSRVKNGPFAVYKAKVWRLTEAQPLNTLPGYEGRAWKGLHVDHVLSIKEAFDRKLPPETVAHISNLRMLPHDANLIKGASTVYTNLFNE